MKNLCFKINSTSTELIVSCGETESQDRRAVRQDRKSNCSLGETPRDFGSCASRSKGTALAAFSAPAHSLEQFDAKLGHDKSSQKSLRIRYAIR